MGRAETSGFLVARGVSVDIIEGKTRLKARRASPQTITDEQIETFFETLVDTCNVVRSAKAAGFSANWAYRRRKFDAAFRDGWAEALADGYAKLELVLLERAIKGTPKLVRASGGKDRTMREYSPQLAISLLKRHSELAASVDRERPADDELAEVRERILEKLERMRQRELGDVETKGRAGRRGAREERIELPAVLTGEQARALVEDSLGRRYRCADRIRFSLPPSRMTLRPGDAIQLPDDPQAWIARSVTIDGLAVHVEAEGASIGVPVLPADPGRPVVEPDEPIGRTELVLFEAPSGSGTSADYPLAFVAATTAGAWKAVPVQLRLGAEPLPAVAVRRRAVAGFALSVLDSRAPMVMDELSSVTVELAGPAALLNADDDALMAGANPAILGDELIQFGRAEEIAAGTFRLSRLLRGRRGTEWAAGLHHVGEPFCLVDQGTQSIEVPIGAAGAALTAVAHGIGDAAPLPQAQRLLTGEAMRPPSPCHLKLWRGGSGIGAQWVRRSHRGWDWLDEVGVPDDPFAELYRVSIEGPAGQVAFETGTPSFSRELADLPASSGEAILLTIATVGPRAISHGISATLTI